MTYRLLQTSHHQLAAQHSMLEGVRGAVGNKCVLLYLLLLMFVGNCQAFMQGQGILESMPVSVSEVSNLADEHDCCPDDEVVQDCESCLDDRAVKPRLVDLTGDSETQLLLCYVLLNDLLFAPSPQVSQHLQEAPPFSSYPAIYLTHLHFLE